MLFNSGTPSLVGWTRALVGDPATAASEQWDDTTEVKPAINRAYLDLREISRSYGMDQTTKRAYADAVASQIYYQRPTDIVRLRALELSDNGSNLSTATPAAANILYPKPWPAEKALQAYNSEVITAVGERFGLQDDHFFIVAPPTSTQAGTNTIRILYESSTSELSGDTDEPELFRPYHDLICYRAAVQLKLMRDMDASDIFGIAQEKEYRFRMACQDAVAMDEDTIAAQGLRQQRTGIVSGTTQRVYRGSTDNDVY